MAAPGGQRPLSASYDKWSAFAEEVDDADPHRHREMMAGMAGAGGNACDRAYAWGNRVVPSVSGVINDTAHPPPPWGRPDRAEPSPAAMSRLEECREAVEQLPGTMVARGLGAASHSIGARRTALGS